MQGSSTAMARYAPGDRRLELSFAGEVDGISYRRCMADWLRCYPDAICADWIYDLRDYRGTVSSADVRAFAELYHARGSEQDRGAHSVFVAPDGRSNAWTEACRAAFPARVVAVVKTLAEARALLDQARNAA